MGLNALLLLSQEVSSCNIFVVKGKTIKTPPLSGTILPGVTRRSIIELARIRGYQVEETPVSITEALEADEIFTTGKLLIGRYFNPLTSTYLIFTIGTAVVVSSVGSLTYRGTRKQFTNGEQPGKVTLEMYTSLTDIQAERAEDPAGWVSPL